MDLTNDVGWVNHIVNYYCKYISIQTEIADIWDWQFNRNVDINNELDRINTQLNPTVSVPRRK